MRFAGTLAVLVAVIAASSGCGKGSATATSATTGAATATKGQPSLLLAAEDLIVVRSSALSSGPAIMGSVQPERRADLQAEVSAVVLKVLKENGDSVRRGDLLVRLDDTAIRESLTAAEAAQQAAARALEQGERQFQRMSTLRKTGVVTVEQLEDAETKRNTEQSDLEAARTRVVTARQQLDRTQVRAPFDGIVSERKVSAGDTAQLGKELLKVIDPHSLRFEGLVSADSIGEVKVGQRVMFRIHGFADREFLGKITRINPAANSTTRQVEVLVSFADEAQRPEVSGLYAEGRIETRSTTALTIPATALVKDGDQAYAWRLGDGVLHKVSIRVGDRDPRSGDIALAGGLAEGDQLLRYPTATLRDGQAVELGNRATAASIPQPRTSVTNTR
ncbi:MAG TPA: efflux RND transporter periplasmic adaptor subunit [Steroidobacteraceae bacterium]